MNKPLTPKQKTIYSFTKKYLTERGYAPTLQEIRSFVGVKSINTIVEHLKALEQKGYIIRRKNAKRNIEIRDIGTFGNTNPTVQIPVMASVGCDSLDIVANEIYDEFLEVDQGLVQNKEKIVAVRAVGNSMNDAGINDGDYALIEVTTDVENGDRVAVIVGDMVTIKKLERKDNLVILRPESKDPKYKPIILSENFKVEGRVIYTIPGNSIDIYDVVPIKENY